MKQEGWIEAGTMEPVRPMPGDCEETERALERLCASTSATSRRSCVSFTTWHGIA